MIQLSVTIITLNEEKNIERCILSVKHLADEILVVDSLSTDATVAIAEKHGARIIHQPFLGHLEQKNFANEKATHDWILAIDADEVISPELADNIAAIKNNPTHNAYHYNRLKLV